MTIDIKELKQMTEKAKQRKAITQKELDAARNAWDKKIEEEYDKRLEKKFIEITNAIPRICEWAASRGESHCTVYTMEKSYDQKIVPDKLAIKIHSWCEANKLNPVYKQETHGGHMIGVDDWATVYYTNWIEVSW